MMDTAPDRIAIDTSGPLHIEAFAGEIRANYIRLIAIIAFYVHHLIQAFIIHPSDTDIDRRYNLGVTLVVIGWGAMVALLHVALVRRRWVPVMKFFVVLADIVLIAALGILSGGPQTPLILLFFVVIASAPLRMSLPLVYVATFGSWIGYLTVVAYYAWVKIGATKYYATPELQIPRAHEIIVLLALGAAGLMAGQVVRQARRLVGGYPVTIADHASNAEER